MANELQDVLLNAIDTVINNRVKQLCADKTVTATIDTCVNQKENKYFITYQGGLTYAYAQNDAAYSKGDSVYVLVPEGDFSKKKLIIGLAESTPDAKEDPSISNADKDYDRLGSNVLSYEQNMFGTSTLSGQIQHILYSYESENNLVQVDEEELSKCMESADALYIGATFNTADIPMQHRNALSGNYGLIVKIAFKSKDGGEDKIFDYVLDTSRMTGNPYRYVYDTKQFDVYTMGNNTYSHIQEIIFFCEGFPELNIINEEDNIFVKDIEISALKNITATSNNYTLHINTPLGIVFSKDDTELTANAWLTYKKTTIDSATVKFYWFKRDVNSQENHTYGGEGWSNVKDYESHNFATGKSDNLCYENLYKVVCVYQDNIVLVSEFRFYNPEGERNITITASPGKEFSFDRGEVDLECLVNGESIGYDFKWIRKDPNETEAILIDYVDGNKVIKYPVKLIDEETEFFCYVSKSDKEIGFASIVIYNNDGIVDSGGYRLVIENSDQVFQYTTGGISPTHTSLAEPMTVKPIQCSFIDPNGNTVDPSTYEIKWVVPETDTMIAGFDAETGTVSIVDNYDVNAANNQLTAIVVYYDHTYTANTSFLFTKVGENGTNGTDIVAKISVDKSIYRISDVVNPTMTLFKNGIEIEDDVSYSFYVNGGNDSNGLNNNNDGLIISGSSGNLILIGKAVYNGKEYYARCPIYVIDGSFNIVIDESNILKYVVYNSNGLNPTYASNKNVCFDIVFDDVVIDVNEVVIEFINGGQDDLIIAKNVVVCQEENSDLRVVNVQADIEVPVSYSGQETNTNVIVKITYKGAFSTLAIPICLSLNTFENAAINGWDGNSIEIDSTTHILAPQVGAGTKDNNNTFSGLVMGTIVEGEKSKTGLVGYANGVQSLFIDSADGSAVFGTANQGQIVLNPAGESTIGDWRIGKKSLYGTRDIDDKKILDDEDSIHSWASGVVLNSEPFISVKGKRIVDESTINIYTGNSSLSYGDSIEVKLDPNVDNVFSIFRHTPSVESASELVFNEQSGELLDPDNTLISKKTDGQWTCINQFKNAYVIPQKVENTMVYYAIQEKPENSFSETYYTSEEAARQLKYRTEEKAGIDANGNFFVSAVQAENTVSSVGHVGAFGSTASTGKYVGTQTEANNEILFKAFTESSGAANSPLYISGSGNSQNEYIRPVYFYGESITLFANDSGIEKQSNYKLHLSPSGSILGCHIVNNNIESGAFVKFTDNTIELTADDNILFNCDKIEFKNPVTIGYNNQDIVTLADGKVQVKSISFTNGDNEAIQIDSDWISGVVTTPSEKLSILEPTASLESVIAELNKVIGILNKE